MNTEPSIGRVASAGVRSEPLWSRPNKGVFQGGDAAQQMPDEVNKAAAAKELDPKEAAALQKACKDFESFFVSQLMKQMRSTIPQGGFLEDSRAVQLYREMLDESLSDVVADSPQGIGIADMLYKRVSEERLRRVYQPSAQK